MTDVACLERSVPERCAIIFGAPTGAQASLPAQRAKRAQGPPSRSGYCLHAKASGFRNGSWIIAEGCFPSQIYSFPAEASRRYTLVTGHDHEAREDLRA